MDAARQIETERVLEATDLARLMGEYISLRRQGREHVGLCPFHDDRSPSLHVVTHKGSHFYKCFACGASGNAFRFVMDFHKMTFPEALNLLADRAGVELTPWKPRVQSTSDDQAHHCSRQQLIAANELALHYYQSVLEHPKAGARAREVIDKRGISATMVDAFQVSAAPDSWDALLTFVQKHGHDEGAIREAGLVKPRSNAPGHRDTFVNRLIFPICDQLGRPIAFGGRILNPDDIPKYLNSPESAVFKKSNTLYALHLARKPITDQNVAIVTEGYTDVIAMHQAGFTNTVATLGTALTPLHARTLQRMCDTVVLLFDGDVAGQKAADRAVEVFFAEPIDVRICILPDGCDPDELLRSSDGEVRLQALLDGAEDALPYLISRFKAGLDHTESMSGRQKHLDAFLARLADLGFSHMSGLRKRMVLPTLADLLGVSIHDVESRIPKRRARQTRESVSPANNTPPQEDESVGDWEPHLEPVANERRVAERDLLSILVFEPAVRSIAVEIGGYQLPVAEAYLPESFCDPSLRCVYEAMHSYLESDSEFTVASLQERLKGPSGSDLVTELYFRGRALCNGDESNAPRKLRQAADALEQARDRVETKAHIRVLRKTCDQTKPHQPERGETLPAFLQVVEARRALGDDRTAAPRGVRRTQ